ncbi:MAG: hypothetical protein KF880_01475 [Ferruginibacter sp.]|nr:hypothetical protein [Ferruginibacter sp.]
MRLQYIILSLLFILLAHTIIAQQDTLQLPVVPSLPQVGIPDVTTVPVKYLKSIDDKMDTYQNRISKKTLKTLSKLSKWEIKLKRALDKADPSLSQKLFASSKVSFQHLLQQYQKGEAIVSKQRSTYDGYRDKLTTQLNYLDAQKESFEKSVSGKIAEVNTKMEEVNKQAEEVDALDDLIQKRKKELLEASLKALSKNKYVAKINKETWYYRETLKNYKDIFSTPGKAENTAKAVLNKIPAFKEFTRKNSMLASLFGSANLNTSTASVAGLQTRAQVSTLINTQLSSGGPNATQLFQQNMQEAQKQLNVLKSKLNKQGNSGFSEMPDFKPNTQKTKTFKQRLEYGFNLQFGKQNRWMPNSSDVAMTIGYKLNDKSVVGIGASYRIGIGSIQKIRITHEGLGLRSFIDWKLKKQFFVSGGFELNHNAGFQNVNELKNMNMWQKSGLLGITRKIPIKTKFSKSTKVQLLYDFLHKQHTPVTQPVLFRVGYNF